MKYIIQRVSDGTNTYHRPCKEAILEGRTHYFTNDDDDNEEYLQMEDYSWTVEFHSLEELNEFIKKHGNIIIEPSWEMDWVVKDEPRPEMLIKIYDSPLTELCDSIKR